MDASIGGNSKVKCSRSWVWHHFKKTGIAGIAMCNYCKEKFKTTGGSTACLRDHFLRHHKKRTKDLKITKFKPPKASETWGNLSNYLVLKNQEETSVSNKDEVHDDCKTELDEIGNQMDLSSLKRKRIDSETMPEKRSRRDFVDSLQLDSMPRDSKVSKRCTSFVWLHFKKTNVLNVALCNYCLKAIKTGGNESSLRYHLMKYHKEKITNSGDSANADTDNDSPVLDPVCEIQNLEVSKGGKKGRSLVWDHFEKNAESKTAVCVYCKEECKTSGNTTNLMLHLVRHHSKLIALDDYVSPKSKNKRHRSFVWKHFTRGSIPNTAVCNYCSIECNNAHGNIVHLKTHLVRFHSETIIDDLGELMASNTQSRKPRSFVWNHFQKSDILNVAICLHCKTSFNTSGNTSNLRDHLIRKHKAELTSDDNPIKLLSSEERLLTDEITLAVNSLDESWVQNKVDQISPRRSKSIVWEHFEKCDVLNKATCLHCHNTLNTSGNTTNLKDHLFRKHKEVLADEDSAAFEGQLKTSDISIYHEIKPKSIPKKRCKSFVWNHFEKSDEARKAICNYCRAELNTSNNTTNLRSHLLRLHTDKIVEDSEAFIDNLGTISDDINMENISKEEPTDVTLVSELLPEDQLESKFMVVEVDNSIDKKAAHGRQSSSFVWNHFQKGETPKTAICIHCNQQNNTSGGTTNLWSHLIRHHKELVMPEHTAPIPQETVTKRKSKSLIWVHFEHNKPSRTAVCLHCEQEFNFLGTTTNLWNHLKRQHKEQLQMAEDGAERSITKSGLSTTKKKPPRTPSRSFVWNHFDKSDTPNRVLCIHCKGHYNTSGNTTNLWNHMLRFHKDLIMMPEKEPEYEVQSDENQESVNQIEILDEDEDVLSGDESLIKDASKSTIWNHYKKSESLQKVVCFYCDRTYNTSGSTSNLWKHLVRCHRDMITEPDEDLKAKKDKVLRCSKQKIDSFSSERSSDKDSVSIYCEKLKRKLENIDLRNHLMKHHGEAPQIKTEDELEATNWEDSIKKHFKRILTPQFAICNFCGTWCETGDDNSNLKTHLTMYHKSEINTDEIRDGYNENESIENDDVSQTLWNHFTKSDIPQFAACNRCGKLAKITEDYSKLTTHLAICETIPNHDDLEGITEESELSSKSPRSKISFVWNHFERILGQRVAICKHCDKPIKTHGNTTNARKHLVTHHKDAVIGEGLGGLITAKPKIGEGGRGVYLYDFLEPRDVLSARSQPHRQTGSLVWQHFQRTKLEQYVICHLCKRLCRYYYNTTNLRKHLVRYHNEVVRLDGELFDEESCDVEEEATGEEAVCYEDEGEAVFLDGDYVGGLRRSKDATSTSASDDEYVILVVSNE